MPRKTLALILGLVLVTVILFVIALQTGKQQGKDMTKAVPSPTMDVAHTVLSMSPDPVEVTAGSVGTLNVTIDTSDNPVTAIQLELLYDPTMVSNVKVAPGPMFTSGVPLINRNNVQTGRYTYALGISPSQQPVAGKGVVAVITFTARGVAGKQSQLIMQPSSLVTARGVPTSVLKSGKGATVVIVAPGSAKTQTAPVTKAPTK